MDCANILTRASTHGDASQSRCWFCRQFRFRGSKHPPDRQHDRDARRSYLITHANKIRVPHTSATYSVEFAGVPFRFHYAQALEFLVIEFMGRRLETITHARLPDS